MKMRECFFTYIPAIHKNFVWEEITEKLKSQIVLFLLEENC